MAIDKPIAELERTDIEALMDNGVPEGRQIEYKRELPGRGNDDKKEFLADVTSFANASGGHLIFGVDEDESVPVALPGLGDINVDEEKQRLENMMRDGVEPRMPGVQIRAIGGFSEGPMLVLQIPQSWASPHMVTFRNWCRFFSRNNAGKYQLDVREIRAAFALSEALPESIKRFRDDRLGKIVADETPIPLRPEPKLALHLLPIAAFNRDLCLDASEIMQHYRSFPPMLRSGQYQRFNVDGVVTSSGTVESSGGGPRAYCQVYRSGIIESVDAQFTGDLEGCLTIRSKYEDGVLETTETYLSGLAQLEVPPPFMVLLSMIGVEGARMYVSTTRRMLRSPTPIDRDILTLPEVILDGYECDLTHKLRPIFDAVWNACGHECSPNYDEEGNWAPR
ncbi:MAG: ATP-binding protein [Planctomycetes bacterium]|nr:ATP-binding protein [Planctomycetota bacterium]